MRLRVGERIQIQPPPQLGKERMVVRLLGYFENVSIITTIPVVNGMRVRLRENDHIVARAFSSQKAFAFTCDVERVCHSPYDYMHLSYPKEVQGSVIRNSPRVRTRISANANPTEGAAGDSLPVTITNLSAQGAMLQSRQQLHQPGGNIRVAFRTKLHQTDVSLSLQGIVRSVVAGDAADGGEGLINHGVQFVGIDMNQGTVLQSLIYQQIVEQPHTLV